MEAGSSLRRTLRVAPRNFHAGDLAAAQLLRDVPERGSPGDPSSS
jgi:hypothetical protein